MRGFTQLFGAIVALIGVSAAISQAPTSLAPVTPVTRASAANVPLPATKGAADLNATDAQAWLDGFMPFALATGGIPGAIVVIVKDGQVLVQKGYGFSDVKKRTPVTADGTLFRPGSVSKLFTWTAVMQLVERGKLDLDRDINDYLDFKIPPRDGKPITLRNIMTHTSGFEESARFTITAKPMELGKLMRETVPARIFPPGVTPAYSNYATAIAGYIVERQSGMPFDDYIDRNILGPLQMRRSTFRQPLPASLKGFMSNGYGFGSDEAQDFEFVGPAPAGSLSATGADMARFMIAHLNQGAGLLRPETARQMHTTKLDILPPLNRMALGFYEQNYNGTNTIGHAGDTQYFHSDLALFLDRGVGIYVSMNSSGKDGAAGPLRTALVEQFADRYFPAPLATGRVAPATAKDHVAMMAGTYANSRGFQTNFLSILNLLGPVKVGANADGTLLVPAAAGLAGEPRNWIEIAPFLWRDANSGERIAAKVVDGKVVRWSFDTISPFMMFDRVPASTNAAWLAPATGAALAVILLTAIGWPAGALARRRYGATLPFTGRRLGVHRSVKILAWLAIAVAIGWITLIFVGLEDLAFLAGGFTVPLILLQILTPIVFVGLVVFAGWSLRYVWREGRWTTKLWAVLVLLAALILLWVTISHHLIGFGTVF